MSATGYNSGDDSDISGDSGTISLEYLYDNETDPDEVTVFNPKSNSLATEWITTDVETAVALDETR